MSQATSLNDAQDQWRRGDFAASRKTYQEILDADPECAEALLQLGHLERETQQYAAAEALHRRAAELSADAPAYTSLGRTLSDSGQGREAAIAFLAAIKADDKYPPAYQHLGELYGAIGQLEAARKCFATAAELDPADPFPRHNLGITAQLAGNQSEAVNCFRAALALRPDYWLSWQSLGDLYRANGILTAALSCYEKLIELQPDSDNLLRLGATSQMLARYDEAIAAYNQALQLVPNNPDTLYNLGTCYLAMGELDRAEEFLQTVLGLQPENIAAVSAMANLHDRRGDYDKGFALLQPLMASASDNAEFWVSLGKLARNTERVPEVLPKMESALKSGKFTKPNRSRMSFTCGLLHDAAGDYDQAFQHFRTGNSLKTHTYQSDVFAESVDRIISIFDRDLVQRLQQHNNTDSCPLFVVGMPRSGSTLLAQILSSHPDIASIGESPLLPQVAAALGAPGNPYPDCMLSCTPDRLQSARALYLESLPGQRRYVVDKLLSNLLNIGLIAILFPNAKIIHCTRHPLDTLLSCYSHDFVGNHLDFSYDLVDLAHYYRQYRKIMDHWATIDVLETATVRYEEIVADTDTTIRSILQFLGLPWDERCLRFHESRDTPNTASYAQVRQPVYASSVGRHKHYQKHLGHLYDALQEFLPDEMDQHDNQ